MKWLILSWVLFLSSNLLAQANEEELACDFKAIKSLNQCFRELNKISKNFGRVYFHCNELEIRKPEVTKKVVRKPPPKKKAIYPLNEKFGSAGADCSAFISTKDPGEYGELGQVIIDYIKEAGVNSIYYKNTLAGFGPGGAICPKWNYLSKDEKEHFWVWTFASIAHDESKCIPTARNIKGSNGVAVGLLQLDDRKSDRNWRGPNCKIPNVSGARENIRCGMDIMAELLLGSKGEYEGAGLIFNERARNTSYWQKLRGAGGGGIAQLIKTHPKCNEK